MRLQEAGAIPQNSLRYLDHDWHKQLTSRQLEAYIRYVFIALKTHSYDLDATEHRTKKLKWDGGVDFHGNNYKRVWNKIVDKIRRYENALPGIWVAAHFSPTFHAVRVAENKGFIDNRPELLVSELSYDIYCKYVDTFSTLATQRCLAAELSVATQLKMLENVIADPDDRIFYIVADKTNVNATPFFRHAFAAMSGCSRGVEKYQIPAAIEYDVNQSLYDALITQPENDWWVSDSLKTVVAQHRKYWSEYDE
jgi:hypothetical protein